MIVFDYYNLRSLKDSLRWRYGKSLYNRLFSPPPREAFKIWLISILQVFLVQKLEGYILNAEKYWLPSSILMLQFVHLMLWLKVFCSMLQCTHNLIIPITAARTTYSLTRTVPAWTMDRRIRPEHAQSRRLYHNITSICSCHSPVLQLQLHRKARLSRTGHPKIANQSPGSVALASGHGNR